MTPAEQAAKAIKDATGWDAESTESGARVIRPCGLGITVWQVDAHFWVCDISADNEGQDSGNGPTPEAAIEAVLPRYRAHITALAADVLPGWPRLEWVRGGDTLRLVMLAYGVRTVLLDGQLFENGTGWIASEYQDIAGYVSTKADIVAAAGRWHAANMPALPLPPFPETPDA